MKKKTDFYRSPGFILGCIALLGALGTGIVTMARYIMLPDRVEAVEKKTDSIEDYIKEQRISNKLIQQQIKQKEEAILSPDGKLWWDEDLGEWRPIKELKERSK